MRLRSRGTGRRRLRLVVMFRRNPNRWAGLGLAVIVAAIVGIQLGESAIAGINPLYFQGAAVHPRDRGAAIDPATVPPPANPPFRGYGWDEGNRARLAACPDCGPFPVGDTYAWVESPRPSRLAGPAWRDSTPGTELEPWDPGETGPPGQREILRYAEFPIEEKPIEEIPVEEPEAPYDE
jgi:hypothetical protein